MGEVHYGGNKGQLEGQLFIHLSESGQVYVQCWTSLSKMVMCFTPETSNLL